MAPADNNPYAPPEAAVAPPVAGDDRGDFFALFVRWEKYRLIYNAILAVETLVGLTFFSWLNATAVVIGLIECAIAANVCFCAGLVLNGYAWWIGLRSRAVGLLIFGGGTLLAMLLAAVTLYTLGMPHAVD